MAENARCTVFFFQMPYCVRELCGVWVVRHHHDGFAEFAIET